MSGHVVLNAVSRALKQVLLTGYQADSGIWPVLIGDENAVAFENPTDTGRNSNQRLSIWLYRVTPDEFMRNTPASLTATDDQVAPPGLPLDLSYLITPFTGSGENDQLVLGKTLQILYANRIVQLRNDANQVAEEIRIMLGRPPLEEISRIWEALREPYRLSLCYDVRVVQLDAELLAVSRVREIDLGTLRPEPSR